MLTTTFDKVIDDEDEHMVIRHAALRGLLMLNKYYARTDDSVVYRFAMRESFFLSSVPQSADLKAFYPSPSSLV
jgi:hypothetical protein